MVARLLCLIGCVVALAETADAQGFPRDVPGVTVTGRATLSAPADLLYVVETLTPVPGAPEDIDRAGSASVDVLRSAGANDAASSASVLDDADGALGRSITGTLHDPTVTALAQVTRAVSDAVKRYPGTLLRTFTAAPGLINCAEVEGRLHALAMDDARARAQRVAAAAGVALGSPTIISPGGLPGYAFPCRPNRMLQRRSADSDADALPLDGKVEFGLFLNVTFSILPRP